MRGPARDGKAACSLPLFGFCSTDRRAWLHARGRSSGRLRRRGPRILNRQSSMCLGRGLCAGLASRAFGTTVMCTICSSAMIQSSSIRCASKDRVLPIRRWRKCLLRNRKRQEPKSDAWFCSCLSKAVDRHRSLFCAYAGLRSGLGAWPERARLVLAIATAGRVWIPAY